MQTFFWSRCAAVFAALSLLLPSITAAADPAAASSDKRVTITGFGAVADGKTLNTEHIQTAINQLTTKGGGTLVVPKGIFVTGAIFLKPGVSLYLEEGAVLKGSTNRNDYPKVRTRIEGHFEEWLPALVNADKVDHLRITGAGTLDGSGDPFWEEFLARRKANPKTTNLNVERPRLALIQNCDDVEIKGITFKDSGFWNLHLYHCKNVLVENTHFQVPSDRKCPSTDGTDIDSCQNVTIRYCTYQVDDDCVCIKGSKGPFAMQDKDSPPVEHIRVIDCSFEHGHGMVTLGSEATIVRDVVVEKCRVLAPMAVVRLKLRPDTAQIYEDIHYRDITLDSTGSIFEMQPWMQYFDLQGQPPPKSIVRNVTISDVKGKYGSFGTLQGNPGQTTISDITLENIDVQLRDEKFNVGHIDNLKTKNVKVNGKPFAVKMAE